MIGIGAPGEDIRSATDAGMVVTGTDDYFLGYGDDEDDVPEGVLQNTWSPTVRVEAGDRFGASLHISTDGNRMVVGAPGEDGATLKDAGAISVLDLSSGCSESCAGGVESGVTLDQSSAGVPGNVGASTQFGATLAERPGTAGGYVVGAPGQAVATHPAAGAVIVMPAKGAGQELHQDTPGVPGAAENGDLFATIARP
jgi:hypothetical protein